MVKNTFCQAILQKVEVENGFYADKVEDLIKAKNNVIELLETKFKDLNRRYEATVSTLKKMEVWKEYDFEQVEQLQSVIQDLQLGIAKSSGHENEP